MAVEVEPQHRKLRVIVFPISSMLKSRQQVVRWCSPGKSQCESARGCQVSRVCLVPVAWWNLAYTGKRESMLRCARARGYRQCMRHTARARRGAWGGGLGPCRAAARLEPRYFRQEQPALRGQGRCVDCSCCQVRRWLFYLWAQHRLIASSTQLASAAQEAAG